MGIDYILLEFLVLQTVAWCVPLYSLYLPKPKHLVGS